MKRDKEVTDMRNFSCGKSLTILYLENIESSEIVEALSVPLVVFFVFGQAFASNAGDITSRTS